MHVRVPFFIGIDGIIRHKTSRLSPVKNGLAFTMLVKIKSAATDMEMDQWAEVLELAGGMVKVRLSGCDVECLVSPDEVIGLQLGKGLAIGFEVAQIFRTA